MTDTNTDFVSTMEKWAAERDAQNKENRANLLVQLRAIGVTEVTAEYEGYGDSGNVEDITVNGGVKTCHWGGAKVGQSVRAPWSVWPSYSKHVPRRIGRQANSVGPTVFWISCVTGFGLGDSFHRSFPGCSHDGSTGRAVRP
jgi:hypothetical protein